MIEWIEQAIYYLSLSGLAYIIVAAIAASRAIMLHRYELYVDKERQFKIQIHRVEKALAAFREAEKMLTGVRDADKALAALREAEKDLDKIRRDEEG